MSSEYQIRRPRRGDTAVLMSFSELIWPDQDPGIISSRWWWHGDPPHAFLAEHRATGDVAAFCGARRVRFRLGMKDVSATTICDWNVSPNHRRKGLGRALAQEAAKGQAFLYTSAISDAAATAFSRLGWVGDTRRPTFVGPAALAAAAGARAATKIDTSELSLEDPSTYTVVDEIHSNLVWPEPVMMVRDATYLRDHLQLAPNRNYRFLVGYRFGRPVGYLLLRLLPKGSVRALRSVPVGLVTDYLVSYHEPTVLKALVAAAARSCVREGAPLLMALGSDESHLRAFSSLGLASPRVPLLGRFVRQRMSSRCMYEQPDGVPLTGRWHLTFADNDTDLVLGSTAETPPHQPDSFTKPAVADDSRLAH